MKFYIEYNNEIIEYNNLCPAIQFIKLVGGKLYFNGANSASLDKYHPTQKPVKLMEYLIKTYTNEKETVLDFTMGSGTTGVACKQLNRDFIGIELDEKYFKIAENRIKKAVRQDELFTESELR